ncbi:multidrug effflux MFS transporter [Adhaeribacter pallidiroseus]|uniref:Bicyclomycin resistance protein like protein n=1 Tax=Adhaeribacter pallidiroseus TaxID=2072847 RepID=A0A369QHQ3_9BACT|nr:multidrug effflux MFS transporter [Adhaeribacter pallidiroseus]RDC64421.1 Bicyclomycin resistance protein like protein [Adhaeribacter pallidiroseus]
MVNHPIAQNSSARYTLFIILTLGILTAIGSISIDMYLPAFPVMAQYFKVPIVKIEHSVTVFLFGMAFGQLFIGPLSDVWGRTRPLKIGLLTYILCAVAGMLTSHFALFLVWRFVQGLAGSTCQVISRALVNDLYGGRKAAHVFTLLQIIMGVSPILAPTIGGFLATAGTWQYLFLLMALISGVALLGCFTVLPPGKVPAVNKTLNLSAIRFGYAQAIKNPAFINYALVRAITNSAAFSFITASPFVFTQLYHLSKKQYGFLFSGLAIGVITAGVVNTFLLKHFSIKHITQKATMVQMLAVFAGIFIIYFQAPLAVLLGILLVFTSMLGLILPNVTALYLAAVPAHNGSASALIGSMSYLSAFFITSLLSLLHNNTAYPMIIMMWCCTVVAFICLRYRT